MDARFDRPDLDRCDDRDLLIREPLDVTEQQRGPLLSWQRPERRLHRGEGFAVAHELREVRSRGDRLAHVTSSSSGGSSGSSGLRLRDRRWSRARLVAMRKSHARNDRPWNDAMDRHAEKSAS